MGLVGTDRVEFLNTIQHDRLFTCYIVVLFLFISEVCLSKNDMNMHADAIMDRSKKMKRAYATKLREIHT